MLIIFGKSLKISNLFMLSIKLMGIFILILNIFYYFRFSSKFLNNSTFVGVALFILSSILEKQSLE